MKASLIVYLIIINIVALALYGIDKGKARHNKWRIPESVLIGVAVIGGGVGALLGMIIWHHKTRKWKFRIFIPLFLIIWVLFTVILLYVETYYRADATALEGLKSDSEVTVTETDFGWFFDGPSKADDVMDEYKYDNWYIGGHSYGPQDGDGVATIPASEQVDRTVGFITGALK